MIKIKKLSPISYQSVVKDKLSEQNYSMLDMVLSRYSSLKKCQNISSDDINKNIEIIKNSIITNTETIFLMNGFCSTLLFFHLREKERDMFYSKFGFECAHVGGSIGRIGDYTPQAFSEIFTEPALDEIASTIAGDFLLGSMKKDNK